jgi:exodeoxyribonuclease VII large subunit
MQAIRTTLQRQKEKVSGAQQRLRALSPMAVLRRGYSLVRDERGQVVMGIDGLRVDALLEAVFADGSARVRVLQLIANLAPAGEPQEGDDQPSAGTLAANRG